MGRVGVLAMGVVASGLLAGCGSTYRPVVTSINPVGPAAQPTKYAVAIASTGTSSAGLVTIVDVAGDTILDTTAVGVNPYYLNLDSGGGEGYVLSPNGTLNSFAISTSLRASDVLTTTLPAGANAASIYSQGMSLYIAQPGLASVGQFQSLPPTIKSVLPTGAAVYTVGSTSGVRAYALVPGAAGAAGMAAAIETGTNTVSAQIPVGINPVYGVMSVDNSFSTPPARRAFVLNHGSNTVSVINAQTNALDTFTQNGVSTSTIPVGIGPIWADLAPTLQEVVVANSGDGTTPGTLSIISIPLCSGATVVTNPNCDPNNPTDAVGFGTLVANVPVGVNPVMVSVLQDGTRAYVANAGNAAAGIAGSVSVVNLTTNTVTATIAGATSTNPADLLVHGHPAYIAATTGTPSGKVYVTSLDANDLTIIRTDTDQVETHLALQGTGISVRVNRQ